MNSTISNELFWLTLNTIFTSLLFIPYAIVRIRKIGIQVFTNPLPGDDPFDEEWAHRAYRAHMNAIENIVIFTPLALAVHVTGTGNEVTAIACATYFWARVLHVPVYIFNIPYIRLLSYLTALGACLVLAYQLLS